MEKAIEVQNLHKAFGERQAVQGIDFSVEKGEIFSLLGPNGAGKTTTISMLSCLLRPDEGDALVMGHSIRTDPLGVKSSLGVVPQEIALYEDMSARENLVFWGKMYGLRGAALRKRVDEVLEIIGLTDRAREYIKKYSGGMKRRVNIGVALLHKPQVIYMDEPTVGIDPQSRRNILDSVVALKGQGMTVLYTTHYMEEAQELSDHIAIMDNGKMIASGTNAELVKIVGEHGPHHRDHQRRIRPCHGSLESRQWCETGQRQRMARSPSWQTTATGSCRVSSRPPPPTLSASLPSPSRNPTWKRSSCT